MCCLKITITPEVLSIFHFLRCVLPQNYYYTWGPFYLSFSEVCVASKLLLHLRSFLVIFLFHFLRCVLLHNYYYTWGSFYLSLSKGVCSYRALWLPGNMWIEWLPGQMMSRKHLNWVATRVIDGQKRFELNII